MAQSPADRLVPGRALTLASVADGAEGLVLADLARAIAAKPKATATSLLVVCRDGACRFLPFPTAVVGEDALVIQSPFVLLEQGELAFYRKRSLALSSLRGCRVEQGGHD